VQVTPGIPVETKLAQQAIGLVGSTKVVFPIFFQLSTTQQHSGEEEVQVVAAAVVAAAVVAVVAAAVVAVVAAAAGGAVESAKSALLQSLALIDSVNPEVTRT